eukprot:ANDGO_00442.mRNA.1 hypothetical protein
MDTLAGQFGSLYVRVADAWLVPIHDSARQNQWSSAFPATPSSHLQPIPLSAAVYTSRPSKPLTFPQITDLLSRLQYLSMVLRHMTHPGNPAFAHFPPLQYSQTVIKEHILRLCAKEEVLRNLVLQVPGHPAAPLIAANQNAAKNAGGGGGPGAKAADPRAVGSLLLDVRYPLFSPGHVEQSQFPGPMPVQLSRKHFSLIRDNAYWVTEKSDGTRCMLYAQHVDAFPRWTVAVRNHDAAATAGGGGAAAGEFVEKSFPLLVNLDINDAILSVVNARPQPTDAPVKSVPVMLCDMPFRIVIPRPGSYEAFLVFEGSSVDAEHAAALFPKTPKHVMRLLTCHELPHHSRHHGSTSSSSSGTSATHAHGHTTTSVSSHAVQLSPEQARAWHIAEDAAVFPLTLRYGWTFSYLFDRRWDLYLCTEELQFPCKAAPVPQGKPEHFLMQRYLLCDGEVVFDHHEQRYNYSIYDLVACCSAPDSPKMYLRSPLSEKIKSIRDLIAEPHHRFYRKMDILPPESLRVLAKTFRTLKQVPELLSYISFDPSSGKRYYKKTNLNDGLVFTPESENLYHFAPGTAHNLFKWKWTDKLSIDFLLIRVQSPIVDPAEHVYEIAFGAGGGEIGLYRRSRFPESITQSLGNSRMAVVECYFHPMRREWQIFHVRTDKTYPNALMTATSTLETLAEHVTDAEIRDLSTESARKQEKEALERPASSLQSEFGPRYEPIFSFDPDVDDTDPSALASMRVRIPMAFRRYGTSPEEEDMIHREVAIMPAFSRMWLKLNILRYRSSEDAVADLSVLIDVRKRVHQDGSITDAGFRRNDNAWRKVCDVSLRQATLLCPEMRSELQAAAAGHGGRSCRAECVFVSSVGQWFVVRLLSFSSPRDLSSVFSDSKCSVRLLLQKLEWIASWNVNRRKRDVFLRDLERKGEPLPAKEPWNWSAIVDDLCRRPLPESVLSDELFI